MMTRWGVDFLSPTSSCLSNANLVLGQNNNNPAANWTPEENKLFENALAHFDRDTPDRWDRVASMIPGKTARDVMEHYMDLEHDVIHIEAGLIPTPGYSSSSFTLDWASSNGCDGLKKRGRISDQERKKGVPWTEDEHRLFLMGLNKYGKGDWRNISRNFVSSRTPTQVASHAQKYFIRLSSGGKDKRRSSIHDITTVNLPDNMPPTPQPSVQSSSSVSQVTDSGNSDEAERGFNRNSSQMFANLFRQPGLGLSPYEMKLQAQGSRTGRLHDSMVGNCNLFFQMHSAFLQPHA